MEGGEGDENINTLDDVKRVRRWILKVELDKFYAREAAGTN